MGPRATGAPQLTVAGGWYRTTHWGNGWFGGGGAGSVVDVNASVRVGFADLGMVIGAGKQEGAAGLTAALGLLDEPRWQAASRLTGGVLWFDKGLQGDASPTHPGKAPQTVASASPCDDAGACTAKDVCANRACGGAKVDRADTNVCTDDGCDKPRAARTSRDLDVPRQQAVARAAMLILALDTNVAARLDGKVRLAPTWARSRAAQRVVGASRRR